MKITFEKKEDFRAWKFGRLEIGVTFIVKNGPGGQVFLKHRPDAAVELTKQAKGCKFNGQDLVIPVECALTVFILNA